MKICIIDDDMTSLTLDMIKSLKNWNILRNKSQDLELELIVTPISYDEKHWNETYDYYAKYYADENIKLTICKTKESLQKELDLRKNKEINFMIDLNLDANELISVNSKCLSMEVMDSLDNENYIIYYSSLWEDNIYQKWLISFKNNYPGKNIRIDEKESFISSSFSERDAESLFNKFNNNKQEKETGSMNLKPLMIENTNTEKDEQLTMLSNLLAKYGKEATLADIVLKERPIGEVRFKFPCDTMYTFDTQDISWKDEVDKSNDSSWLTIPQAIETYFKELTICTERHDKDNNTYAKMTEMFSRISIDQIVKLFTTGLLINDVKVKPIESERPIDESELTNYISELYVMFRDEYYPFDYYINSKVRDIK